MSSEAKILVILAAGASSRMKKSLEGNPEALKQFQSKALLPLGDASRPAIHFLICNAKEAGFDTVILVVPKESSAFRKYFGNKDRNNSYESIRVSYAIQEVPEGRNKPLGTADALVQTLDQYPELQEQCFVVCNGDNLYSVESLRMVKNHSSPNALIAYDRDGLDFPETRILSFALMDIAENGMLQAIHEKPDVLDQSRYLQEDGTYRVSMNLWKFSGQILYPFIKNCPMHPIRMEKELPVAVLSMIESNTAPIACIPVNEHVPDLTTFQDIRQVEKYLKK